MPSNVSGILNPTNSIVDDIDLDTILAEYVKIASGLPDGMVRPTYQPVTPKMPEFGVDWAAVGVKSEVNDADPAITHYPDGDGYSELMRTELIEVSASFYGTNAKQLCSKLRDSFHIGQNHWWFNQYSMTLRDCGNIVPSHDFHNNQWHKRYDLTFRLNRCIIRRYEILNLLSATVDFNGEEINA